MKILYITSRHPYPPIGGDRLRAYHFIRCLKLFGHEIRLVSLTDAQAPNPITDLNIDVQSVSWSRWRSLWGMLISLFCGRTLQEGYFRDSRIQSIINKTVNEWKPDLVFCHLFRTYSYVRGLKIPVCVDLTDAISLNYQRVVETTKIFSSLKAFIYRYEFHRCLKIEIEVLKNSDLTLLISKVDRDYLLNKSGIQSLIIGNGVDMNSTFNPNKRSTNIKNGKIVFCGNMSSLPNCDAVEFFITECWPTIYQKCPHATFDVLGANVPNWMIEKFGHLPGIFLVGRVESMADAISDAELSVAPMRLGAGIQNKILESMSIGIPVLTTSVGLEGIPAKHLESIFVADSPNDISNFAIQILNKNLDANVVSHNAQELMQDSFSWEGVLKPLNERLQDIQRNI